MLSMVAAKELIVPWAESPSTLLCQWYRCVLDPCILANEYIQAYKLIESSGSKWWSFFAKPIILIASDSFLAFLYGRSEAVTLQTHPQSPSFGLEQTSDLA